MTGTLNKRIVLTGSFGTGKTTILKELEKCGFPVIQENSRKILELWNVHNNEITGEREKEFQRVLIDLQISAEKERDEFITDTGLLENLAYSTHLDIYEELKEKVNLHLKEYDIVFYFPLLNSLEDDGKRYNNNDYQLQIDTTIKHLYKEYGYTLVEVPIIGETIEDQIEYKVKYIKTYLETV